MERLRSLIKEVLSTPPKKKDCNCGCGGCDKKAPIITEGRIKKAISEGLTYHVENKIPLHESVYRIGSEKHFALINEARKLWTRGLIDVSEDDQAILETHLGNFGMYEGEKVPLDMPMVNEARAPKTEDELKAAIEDAEYKIDKYGEALAKMDPVPGGGNWSSSSAEGKKSRKLKDAQGKLRDKIDTYTKKLKKLVSEGEEKEYYVTYNKGRGQGKGLVKSKESNYEEPRVFSKEEAEEYAKGAESRSRQMTAYWVSDKDMNRLNEAKKKKKKEKKDPPLNKPKRGGSKAYYVYVRDPKTKKIKKVSFGSGGLRAKIKNKEARNAFAARHNCKNKKDRTKAGYWSCNLPRYADQLGLGSKMNTFW